MRLRFRGIARLASILIGVAVLILVIAWMSGVFHSKIDPQEVGYRETPVDGREVATVATLSVQAMRDAVGSVQPRLKADVASQILATILTVTVRPGERVKAGQLLATLDDREIQAQLRDAEAALTAANVELAVRKREFERYEKLMADKVGTEEEFEEVTGAYNVAKAQVDRAQQQIDRIDVLKSYTRIVAQSDGVVVDRFADPGDLAAPGKPIVSLHDPTQLELHANVDENLAERLKLGMDLPVAIDAVSLKTEGSVREIVPQAQVASRTFLVKVSLPPAETGDLYVGMFGRLSIPLGEVEHVVVPRDAVEHIGQLAVADVVTPQGTLERRFVRTGLEFGDKIEILSGLQVGEKVARPLVSETPGPEKRPATQSAPQETGRANGDRS